jgi:hypothetical protein
VKQLAKQASPLLISFQLLLKSAFQAEAADNNNKNKKEQTLPVAPSSYFYKNNKNKKERRSNWEKQESFGVSLR